MAYSSPIEKRCTQGTMEMLHIILEKLGKHSSKIKSRRISRKVRKWIKGLLLHLSLINLFIAFIRDSAQIPSVHIPLAKNSNDIIESPSTESMEEKSDILCHGHRMQSYLSKKKAEWIDEKFKETPGKRKEHEYEMGKHI